jgi:hypothetical protein
LPAEDAKAVFERPHNMILAKPLNSDHARRTWFSTSSINIF